MWVLRLSLLWWISATGGTGSPSSPDDAILTRLDSLERLMTVQDERFQREREEWNSYKTALENRLAHLAKTVYSRGADHLDMRLKDPLDAQKESTLQDPLQAVDDNLHNLAVLKSDNADLKDRLAVLEKGNRDLRYRLTVLETDVSKLRTENSELKKGVHRKQEEYGMLPAETQIPNLSLEIIHKKLPFTAPKQESSQTMASESSAERTATLLGPEPRHKTAGGQTQPARSLQPLTDENRASDRPLHKDNVTENSPRSVASRADDQGPLEAVVEQLSQQMTQVAADVETLRNANALQDAGIQQARGSAFVRWGHSACPPSAELMYAGLFGGSHNADTGAATNALCLSLSTVLRDPLTGSALLTNLYGGEYETYDSRDDHDPVCAVCRSSRSATVMVPGTDVCSQGWTLEYSGFLMAGHYSHPGGTEFICVDSALEERIGSDDDHAAHLLYFTKAVCGSLPCPPYENGRLVTCAVCSK